MKISLDNFLDGKIKLYQPKKGYRAGTDAVLLAASVKEYDGCSILDAGSGVGVISYCLAYRCKNIHLIGIEKNKDYHQLAKNSLKLNKLISKVKFINKDFNEIFDMKSDIIVSNPPWFRKKSTLISNNHLLNEAKIESINLDQWISKVINNLKDKGEYYTIFPYNRIKEIIQILKKYFGIIKIYPISSFREKPPDKAIIYAKKMIDRHECLEFDKIVIHKNDKTFTKNINEVLRKGSSLSLA